MKNTLTIVLATAIWISLPITPAMGQTQKAKNSLLKESLANPPASAAALSYSFSQTTGNYQNLTGATSINNGIPWDDPTYNVPMDFPFTMFGKRIDSLTFDLSLGGSLMGYCGSDSTYQPVLLPFDADLIDLGYYGVAGTSLSPLSYKVEQGIMPFSRILKIEWQNAGSYDDTTYSDFVNFQLWLYEGSEDIEIHIGPSSIAVDTLFFYGNAGPLVGFFQINPLTFDFANINCLSGMATSPTLADSLSYLTGVPTNGTIYKFTNLVAGTDDPIEATALRAYPIPASEALHLVCLYNTMGQQVAEYNIATNSREHRVPLSGLAPGIYHLHLLTEQGHMTKTIVKE